MTRMTTDLNFSTNFEHRPIQLWKAYQGYHNSMKTPYAVAPS